MLMFEIDETRYYSSRVSFRMFTLENVLDGKKLKIQLAGGVGIRMSWVEKFRKIN